MEILKNELHDKILKYSFLVLLFLIVFGTIGNYVGGWVFLLSSRLDTGLLNFDTLWMSLNYWGYKKSQFPVGLGVFVFLVITLAPILLIFVGLFINNKVPNIYGDASFITDKELAESGLLLNDDDKYPEILIGKVAEGRYKDQYLKFVGQQFLGVGAPTRSGKGVGLVIPNLLNYRDSVVVLDIKGENLFLTGGYRKQQGQDVFVFSPDGFQLTEEDYLNFITTDAYKDMSIENQALFDERYKNKSLVRTHRWNPLSYINRSKRVSEIKDMASILFPDNGGDNAIWNGMATGLFTGLCLYMLDMEKLVNKMIKEGEDLKPYPVSIAQMFKLTGVGNLGQWMNEEILYWSDKGTPLSTECVESFNRFISTDPKTQGNILQNFNHPLNIFESESCRLATSDNDFDFEQLRKKRISIYIVLSPSGITKYGRLINLFFSQLITVNTATLPEHDPTLKYQCLLMLDEFTSMGRVGIIEKSIAFTAGYNVRYMIIYQDDAQLESENAYKKEGTQSLKSNIACEIIYPPKAVGDISKRVSATFGTYTMAVDTDNKTTQSAGGSSKSKNRSYFARPLMNEQEVVQLGSVTYVNKAGKNIKIGIKEIIIMEKVKPIIAHKIIYFDEPEFVRRKDIALKNIPSIPILEPLDVYALPRDSRSDIPELKK